MREIVACGQSGERAYRFRFLTCLRNSNSPIPTLDALVHLGNKGFVSKEWPEHVLFLLFLLSLPHCFPKQVSEPAGLVWTLGIFELQVTEMDGKLFLSSKDWGFPGSQI